MVTMGLVVFKKSFKNFNVELLMNDPQRKIFDQWQQVTRVTQVT